MNEVADRFPFNPKAPGGAGPQNRFWVVERCWNCPNAVIDLEQLVETVSRVMEQSNFETLREKALATSKPMHHQVFRISVSGCPNSCSQPQIKDLGIQGQAVPRAGDGCTLCGECVATCPDGAITLGEGGPEIDRESCLNCGRCTRACPAGILTSPAVGFRVLVGGKLGRRPRLAETAVSFGGAESVEAVLQKAVGLLTNREFARERLGAVIEKKGMKWFLETGSF